MDSDDQTRSALDWPSRSGTADLLLRELAGRAQTRSRRRRILAGATAMLGLAAGIAWWSLRPPLSSTAPTMALVARATLQTLPDGSTVELKDDAQIAAHFASDSRRVELLRGTAHFQVLKDAARPFIVHAGGVAVRAVGTAFSVERGRQRVEVLVTEGRVAVEPSDSSVSTPADVAKVEAGSGVVLELPASGDPRPAVVRSVAAAELETKLAWRARQIELSGTPLVEVVALLNRHAVRFTIADPEIEQVKLSGAIRTDKTEALIHLLEAECGIRAERKPSGHIVLHQAR